MSRILLSIWRRPNYFAILVPRISELRNAQPWIFLLILLEIGSTLPAHANKVNGRLAFCYSFSCANYLLKFGIIFAQNSCTRRVLMVWDVYPATWCKGKLIERCWELLPRGAGVGVHDVGNSKQDAFDY
jgi:hypothetical protein